jgi:hypothetical protein
MAFELFTGNVPFHDSEAPMAILLRHVNDEIPPVKSLRPEVDERISVWIQKLLIKEPAGRTQNAQDAWDDFEEILLSLLGPRWRREARLVERVGDENAGAKPLTPAPFPGTSAGEASEEFKSYAWGQPANDTNGNGQPMAAPPPMFTPPPSASLPVPPPPVVGPSTPLPSQAIPVPPEEPSGDTGFVTFGVPAPPPPTGALIPSVTPEPEAPAPAEPVSEFIDVVAPTPPAEEPPAVEEEQAPPTGFRTFIAPEPLRPPTTPPQFASEPAPPAPELAPVAAAPVAPAPEPVAVTPPPPPVVADTLMPNTAPPVEPPPRTPAPQQQSPSGRPAWLIPAAIVGGLILLGIIAIVALGGGGGGDKKDDTAVKTPTAAPTQAASIPTSAQGIALTVPAGWEDAGATTEIPGFADGAVTMSGPKGGTIVFGRADTSAENPTLLADDLRTAAGDPLPEPATAELGDGLQAARYDKLNVGQGQSATFFAVPTTAGVASLACLADADVCKTISESMKITDGKAFPIGPSEQYATAVESTLAKLEKSEKTAANALRSARKRATQVDATSKLATAYSGAAAKLDKLEVSPADAQLNAALVASVRKAGSAYKKAASEGRAKDRNGYRTQGQHATAAGKDIKEQLDGLNAVGYQFPAKAIAAAAATTKLPTLIKDKPKATRSSGSNSTSSTPPPTTNNNNTTQQNNTTPPPTNNNPPPTNNNPPPTHNNPPPTHNNNSGGKKDPGLSGGGEG